MTEFRIGEAFVEVHARGTDGAIREVEVRLQAARGRFAAAGDAAGRGYGDGLSRGVGNGANAANAHLVRLGSTGSMSTGMIARGALGAGANLLGLAAAAGAAGAAIGVLPTLAAGVGLMGGTIMAAFKGVGGALEAYKADQDAAGKSAADGAKAAGSNARAIRDASTAINDARRNQQRVREQSATAIANAERSEARAARDGREQVAEASRRVTDALDDERDAQEDLTEARDDAVKSLEDLREQVSDYALDEEGASLAVREAAIRLQTANRDVFASSFQREEAAHNLAVAEERLSDIQRDRAEKTAELAAADRAGVDGSERVVAAQERVTDAHERVTAARENLGRTERDTSEANQEASRRTAEVVAQAGQSQEDAALDVARAVQSLKDVQDQQAASSAVAATQASKFRDAMAELSPAARALVMQLLDMQPLVDKLSDTAAAAFLPGVTQMLKDSEGLFPVFNEGLKRTGGIMGDTARDFGKLFKSPEFKSDLDALFKSTEPVTKSIGDLFVGITKDVVGFGAEVGGPAGQGFARFLDGVRIGVKGFFDELAPHKESFKKIFDQLGIMSEWLLPAFGSALGTAADFTAWFLEKVNLAKVKIVEWWRKLDDFAIWWDSLGPRARVAFDRLVGTIGDRITWAKDTAVRKARELVDGVAGWFHSLPDTTRRAFDNVADAIGRALSYARDKAKEPIRWVIDLVYNNGIRGLWDKVRGVFGGNELPYFMPFAKGGLVPGQDKGYDYIPAMLRGGEGVLVPEAVRAIGGAAGIERLNRMAEVQGFAKGGVAGARTSASASITRTTGSVQAGGGLGDFMSQLFTDPLAAVRSLFSGVVNLAKSAPGSGLIRGAMVGLPGKVIDLIVGKAKGLFAGGGPAPAGQGVQRWSNLVLQALGMVGEPAGLLNTVLRRMNQESGGNPRAINNWDINAMRGIPSKGLMQTIDPTFRAYHFPGTSWDVYDPLANILASMNYAKSRYGSLSAAYNRRGGYDQGGLANGVGMLPKYTPEPERVLSPRQTEAFERLVDHLTATGGAGMGGRPVQVVVQQTSGSPAETGRFVSLALRSA